MNFIVYAGILALTALNFTLYANEVRFWIDYQAAHQCSYDFQYTSQGRFKQKGTVTKKATTVDGQISIAAGEREVNFRIDTIALTSDLYPAEKQKEINGQLAGASYEIPLVNGYPIIDTSVDMQASPYIEWDLYRQLVKLLPSLPEKKVRPGYTWEQTIYMPLKTARGKVPCELYRFYTFKKLKGDTVTVVWNFRYAPVNNVSDSTAVLKEVPIGGKGTGSALIDIKTNSLILAEMNFTTPVAVLNDISVTWQERAVFRKKACK